MLGFVAFVAFVVGVLVVGALLFLGASLLLGRAETRPPAERDASPLALPGDRPVTADDVRGVQLSVSVRGYRMTEVDWLLDQLAGVLEERDAQLAALRAQVHPAPEDAPNDGQGPAADGDAATADDEESPRA
jgi:DivIVA domain-containing protein